ncbi:MAG: FtsX-like permease family protein [Candidatus Thorarchaeota archaeon]
MRASGTRTLGSLRRRIVTFLCFLMAISICISVFIFVDSVSLEKWDECNDIGPVAMRVQGENMQAVVEDIKDITQVSQAAVAETAQAYLRMDKNSIYQGSPTDPINPMFLLVGQAYSFNTDFSQAFPTEFELAEGRYPENSSEIAIAEADADYWGIPIGRMMNYSHFLNSEKRTIFVVGFFKTSEDALRSVITDAIAIVTSEVLNPETVKTKLYIDTLRDIVSPIDPIASLSILRDIESTIHESNPSSSVSDTYLIDDYLAEGIHSYIDYISSERNRQISRAQSLIILAGLLSFLGTRFNISMREEELTMLKSRGATRARIFKITMGELAGISVIAGLIAILLGSLLTKLAWISTGYLTFIWADMVVTPLLITYDTLIALAAISFIIPIFGYLANQMIRSVGTREVEYGRLARVTRSFRLIRWDVSLVIVVGLLLASLYLGGSTINDIPLLSLMAAYSTIPVFIAMASIFNKSLQSITSPVSIVFRRAIGHIQANVGIRGVAKNGRLSLPVILILSIVIASSFANDAIATSLPSTHEIHSRFIIGGDLSFHLENDESANWTNFAEVVNTKPDVTNSSFVSIGLLSLSEGPTGVVEFIAINPAEYSQVGYSYAGVELSNCDQTQLLQELESNPEGVILTSDIASEYNLLPGDTLRVFSFGADSGTAEFNILGTINAIPRPITSGQPTTDAIVGTRKVWLNREYVDTLVNLNESSNTYLCVKTARETNTTTIGLDILQDYGTQILSLGEWSSSTADVDSYISQTDYKLDRSIDSMITIAMIFSVIVGFVTYQIDQRYKGRDEYALLKSMGVSDNQITKIRFSESLGLVILSLMILLFFGPFNIANLLRTNFMEYAMWSYVFPISLFNVVNWTLILTVLGAIIIPSLLLILWLSKRNRYSDISGILREMLQEDSMMEGFH